MQALLDQGKTKHWLHKRSGIARNTIDRWRTQPKPPQAGTVIAVADALGMDRTQALQLGGVMPPINVVVDGETIPLADVDTDVLLAEVRRRIPD